MTRQEFIDFTLATFNAVGDMISPREAGDAWVREFAAMGEPESGLRGDPVAEIGTEEVRATKDSSSSSTNVVVPEAESGPAQKAVNDFHVTLIAALTRTALWNEVPLVEQKRRITAALLVPAQPSAFSPTASSHTPEKVFNRVVPNGGDSGQSHSLLIPAAPPEPETTTDQDLSRLPGFPGSEHGDEK